MKAEYDARGQGYSTRRLGGAGLGQNELYKGKRGKAKFQGCDDRVESWSWSSV